AAGEIRVPDGVVGRDREAAWPRGGIGQWVLRDLHGCRIDAADLVDAELVEERNPFRVDQYAVRPRARGGWLHELDLAALRIEAPDEVDLLNREPGDAVAAERERVRIARGRIRQLVFGHGPGVRIELSDQAAEIPGEPDIAVRPLDQAMRAGLIVRVIFLDRAGLRVDAAEVVGELPGVPDGAVA